MRDSESLSMRDLNLTDLKTIFADSGQRETGRGCYPSQLKVFFHILADDDQMRS
jgi:hypothetical protein